MFWLNYSFSEISKMSKLTCLQTKTAFIFAFEIFVFFRFLFQVYLVLSYEYEMYILFFNLHTCLLKPDTCRLKVFRLKYLTRTSDVFIFISLTCMLFTSDQNIYIGFYSQNNSSVMLYRLLQILSYWDFK